MWATASRRLSRRTALLGWTAKRLVHLEASKPSVESVIKANNVVMFSKTYCPSCERAQALFEGLETDHEIFELDERDDGDKLQKLLTEMTGKSTVPYVFIKGKFMGGFDDVIELHAERKLEPLVHGREQ